MKLLDFLAPRPRCVVLGCKNRALKKETLCADHRAEFNDKIRRVVERVTQARQQR